MYVALRYISDANKELSMLSCSAGYLRMCPFMNYATEMFQSVYEFVPVERVGGVSTHPLFSFFIRRTKKDFYE